MAKIRTRDNQKTRESERIMKITEARKIIGEATDKELRETIDKLEAKDFLFLESDIARLKACKVLLKANRNNLKASLNRDVRIQ